MPPGCDYNSTHARAVYSSSCILKPKTTTKLKAYNHAYNARASSKLLLSSIFHRRDGIRIESRGDLREPFHRRRRREHEPLLAVRCG
ncbi:hypothetical protein BRADI_5g22211v3 [Brachypodium distachyon]|uniref:Uncharacterized protein n=1 Tax=Brachypodium distachyon TaxID=15368 RepID=A0A0Q3IEU4_BRADI|nr:hypothetical protein BRADI_5g22211v3 [Brachypodium distachyon]